MTKENNLSSPFSRRSFVQGAGVSGAAISFGSLLGATVGGGPLKADGQSTAADERFFLTIYVQGGMDPTYMLDARPKAMTDAGKIQNYRNDEPTVWEGSNGQKTLASSLIAPLQPFKNDLLVLNGVLMAASFDGHDQNLNYLLTGNPFGGESFIPHLNSVGTRRPLDFIQSGSFFGLAASNNSAGVPLSVSSTDALQKKLSRGAGFTSDSLVMRHARARMNAAAGGNGSFSRGTQEMIRNWPQVFDVAGRVKAVDLSAIPANESINEVKFAHLAMQAFKTGMTRCATIAIFDGFDVHDSQGAKTQPDKFTKFIGTFSKILTLLRDTPFDAAAGKSFLDVTTVLVASEFGRTMRQDGLAIDATGTDHNPLSNTIIMAGKGVRGGTVLGESDFAAADETLSGAHKVKDQDSVKIMGRPFDVAAGTVRSDKPEEFKLGDYLTFASIANGLYESFGVDRSKHWLIERNGTVATPLRAAFRA